MNNIRGMSVLLLVQLMQTKHSAYTHKFTSEHNI